MVDASLLSAWVWINGRRHSLYRSLRKDPARISRFSVYNELLAIGISMKALPTAKTVTQAERLFGRLGIGGYKISDKLRFFTALLHTAKLAMHGRSVIMYSRSSNDKNRFTQLQVIDAAVRAGLFIDHRSPPGSPMMSRLVPSKTLFDQYAEIDPWEFDPPEYNPLYIQLRSRESREPIPFDLNAPENVYAQRVQKMLERINSVNSSCEISYRPVSWLEEHFAERRQIRPVHVAVFTDNWDLHGRLYTGRHGHQGLSQMERCTIQFDGEPCVELDFSGFHCRMLYHLYQEHPYKSDPYALWGKQTTENLRLLAKNVVNRAINARSKREAVGSCYAAIETKTGKDGPDGEKLFKTGKSLRDAKKLRKALRESGMSFDEVYDMALRHHEGIENLLGDDAGIRLMRIDGEIAVNVMHAFAYENIPVLGCHDSFIVPRMHEKSLLRLMKLNYVDLVGQQPIIKRSSLED